MSRCRVVNRHATKMATETAVIFMYICDTMLQHLIYFARNKKKDKTISVFLLVQIVLTNRDLRKILQFVSRHPIDCRFLATPVVIVIAAFGMEDWVRATVVNSIEVFIALCGHVFFMVSAVVCGSNICVKPLQCFIVTCLL